MAYRVDENGEYKRTVRCGHCYEKGHNRLSCPKRLAELPDLIKQAKESLASTGEDTWERSYASRRLEGYEKEYRKMTNRGKDRVCGFCRKPGHNRATCPDRLAETKQLADETIALRRHTAKMMEEAGFGVGALINIDRSSITPVLGVITNINLGALWSREHKYTGGSYFYPPQIIHFQLVKPRKDSYSDMVTTHGSAYVPAEFLNPDGHEMHPSITENRRTTELVSDVACSGLLSDELLDFKQISKYVCDHWVDPR